MASCGLPFGGNVSVEGTTLTRHPCGHGSKTNERGVASILTRSILSHEKLISLAWTKGAVLGATGPVVLLSSGSGPLTSAVVNDALSVGNIGGNRASAAFPLGIGPTIDADVISKPLPSLRSSKGVAEFCVLSLDSPRPRRTCKIKCNYAHCTPVPP